MGSNRRLRHLSPAAKAVRDAFGIYPASFSKARGLIPGGGPSPIGGNRRLRHLSPSCSAGACGRRAARAGEMLNGSRRRCCSRLNFATVSRASAGRESSVTASSATASEAFFSAGKTNRHTTSAAAAARRTTTTRVAVTSLVSARERPGWRNPQS
jgi:hypothetical protein